VRKIIIVIVLLSIAVPAFAKFDPSFRWATLETPHFLIHHHQGGEEAAQRAARIAEDVHARLAPRMRWEPSGKTHLVLVDAMDEANGYATPIPYNRVVIFLTQPLGEPGFGATSYEDWLRLVITHEYAHILQIDMVTGGLGGALQSVLGRIYFPNLFQPEWLIEGLATYEETEQTSGGRGRSPGADMVLRMAALEGPFPTLDRMAVFPDTWPSGQVPYLFGESFTRFIAEKYGGEKLAEISTAYSGRWIPFLVDSTAYRVLHQQYGKLWREWEQGLQALYREQEEDIRARGMTIPAVLTRKGYLSIAPAVSPDGKRIAYSVANGDEFPGIYLMNADGSGDRKLVENVFPSSASGAGIAWSPDGTRIYYTKIEVRGANYYNDLYAYDVRRDAEERLTRELRARDPHPSPDERKVLFVMNRLGMTRLALLDVEQARRKPAEATDAAFLTDWSADQYEHPRFSPDGSKIAVAVWQPGGNKDVRVLDAQGNKLEEITHDRAIDGAPAWSTDGRILYFSSDRTGVFNIYAYEFETGKLFQVTNVLGGAFTPSPSPDGKSLAFSSYSAKGFDIHSLPIDPASWKTAEPYRSRYPAMRYEEQQVAMSSRPYSPWATILPRFWLPWFGYSHDSGMMYGAITFNQDAVERHQYVLEALYGPKHNRVWYSFDYLYDGLPPTIHLQASDADVTYTDLFEAPFLQEDYEEREKTFGLSVITPLVKTATQHYITLGYRWRELIRLTTIPPWYAGPLPGEGVLASGWLTYLFNSSRKYDFSISPEGGRTLKLGYERLDKSLGSDYEFHKYIGDWHEYLDLPWRHHVLSTRAFAGIATGADSLKLPQGVFQLGGDSTTGNPQDAVVTLENTAIYLRGYPVNAFRGRKAVLASVEYRFPVVNVERGEGSLPYFLRRLHGAVFFEAGNAWNNTFHHADLKRSAGAEARLDLTLAYFLPVTLRVGIAAGLDEEGETVPTFGLWLPLEL
jgi:hypothetical protein